MRRLKPTVKMIEEIRGSLKIEIRPDSQGFEYLEAVIRKNDLELLKSILTKYLGPAAKEPGTEASLSTGIRKLVDSMGGLRIEQTFFCRHRNENEVAFAVLWPWQSNPEKITLKAGISLI